MSYSRWSNSIWYTYWRCNFRRNEERSKYAQVFEICGVVLFTYGQLRENMCDCIDWAVYKHILKSTKTITKKQREELEKYMKQFMKDVEYEFTKKIKNK